MQCGFVQSSGWILIFKGALTNDFSYRIVQSVADVVRRGRSRWFGHLECRNGDD